MKFNLKKKGLKSIVTIMALTMALNGCSNSNSNAKPDEDMNLKLYSSSSLINGGKTSTPWTNINFTTGLLFKNLFIASAGTSEVEPDLIDTYKISEDALVYEFNLKNDIVWSDGEVLDVEDVVFSFESILLVESANQIFTTAFKDIKGAEEFIENPELGISGLVADIDNNKLTITLKNPIATFMQILAQFAILPEHILGNEDVFTLNDNDFWYDPVVSGLYKLGEHIPGESLTYIYNDKYTGQAPNIYSLVMRNDFGVGEMDFYDTNDVAQMLDYRAVSNMTEYSIDTLFYRYFIFNIDKGGEPDPVMSDIRVRQALTYAIDRETLIKDIYYNTGSIINTGVVKDYNNPLDVDYPYDPEKAKALLQEAEYDFNRPITLLYYYSDETSIKFIKAVAEYLEAIGLSVELLSGGNLYNEEFDSYDMGLKGLSAFNTIEWYNEYKSSNQMHNEVFGGEPMFDDLVDKLNSTLDIEEKVDILEQLQQLEYDLLYKYPIFSMGHNGYVSNNVILPDGMEFGSPRYKYDVDFEDWTISNKE